MNIILTATETALSEAWDRHCGDLPNVTVYRGSILDLTVDAVVSPANSFGFMDGGIDLVYSNHFGWGVQEELQRNIRVVHGGELLVGKAIIVRTGNANIPYMISAPTMRVPSLITGTVNAYLAARAALRVFLGVGETIALPGMGTGVGHLPSDICAKQVCAAIRDVCVTRLEFPKRLADAHIRHLDLLRDT